MAKIPLRPALGGLAPCLALVLNACAPRIVYQKVYIPTKCQITPTKRPSKDLGVLEYLQELLIYTEQLELDLQHCIDNSVSRPKNALQTTDKP